MSFPEGKKAARQRLIVAELGLSPAVRTSDLARRLGVSAETVRRGLESFLAETGADEIMVASAIHDHAARVRSYEILAEVHGALRAAA